MTERLAFAYHLTTFLVYQIVACTLLGLLLWLDHKTRREPWTKSE